MSENPTSGARNIYEDIPDGEAAVLFPAVHIAMMLTALADKYVGQNEKDALVQVFYAGHRWHMSPQAALTNLQTLVTVIEMNEELWPTLFENAQGLSGESKIEILRACTKMALMDDGEIGPEEEERIDRIASWIKIEPQDFDKWKAEYRQVKKATPHSSYE